MRKLIYAINLTVDGCFDHTKVIADDTLHYYWTNMLSQAGLLLYGRTTYELMVPYWPEVSKNRSSSKSDLAFADAFNNLDIVVFSRTLEPRDDGKTRIVATDLAEEIGRLKQIDGKDILAGGVQLSSQLIALGLVDEFVFVVHPVLAGSGKRLMEGVDFSGLQLQLINARTFESGIVELRYSKP